MWQPNNALAAFQNTLTPPRPCVDVSADTQAQGRAVFERAGCAGCHSGPALTNNRVIPAPEIGTEPARARGLKGTEEFLAPPLTETFDTPIPVPPDAPVIQVPTDHIDPELRKLTFAHEDSPGGYKVPSLRGLYWTAPYLQDGAVAVGPDADNELGLPGTLMRGIPPHPANSLRAMVDSALRRKVIAANQSSNELQAVHVQGIGHEYWVDTTTGFSREEQEALIQYLLTVD